MIESADVTCPFCGETNSLGIDTSAGREQTYTEDCTVCCRPMEITVRSRPGRILSISADPG